MVTFSDLKFISPSALRGWFRNGPPSERRFTVIDVRDSDYVGGHIRGSWHYPSSEYVSQLAEIRQRLVAENVGDVVFHCALSQQRGPSAALKFIRSLDEPGSDPEALRGLQVWVLEGGFTKWQQQYGEDSAVTEGYDKELWQWQ
ncbi:Rhodanese-like protein [Suhomyces tanzawaensis NRRL Y-17324]|uniref:Rhodanese-like protein n=1 Tax=Suhomyces tanzawaensis NRRL Y-17324 TaxID=984487 RepID=A0A1E4SE56_9ASCO|nr:Rhodanese-like protein [Suhomyces tanzawaensis NRRL Y-17324]ODV77760.1 Rhodanese-like protein [Suhomyces tanzawaensis NRRL Y-17324]